MKSILLNTVPCPESYEAYLLPVSKYPMPEDESAVVEAFTDSLVNALGAQAPLSSEVFMQLEQMVVQDARRCFSDNARAWMPKTGLGVWVDREPPHIWTREEVSELAPGDKMRPIMFQVFRVSKPQPIRSTARTAMLRFGSVLEILTPLGDRYLPTVKPIFLNGITDRSYTCFPYYVGFMEAKTLAGATAEQLSRWLNGVSVYIRQSFEDRAILVASTVPLTEVLEQLGGKRTTQGWSFPV